VTSRFEAVSAVLVKVRFFRHVRPRRWASGSEVPAVQLVTKTKGNTRQNDAASQLIKIIFHSRLSAYLQHIFMYWEGQHNYKAILIQSSARSGTSKIQTAHSMKKANSVSITQKKKERKKDRSANADYRNYRWKHSKLHEMYGHKCNIRWLPLIFNSLNPGGLHTWSVFCPPFV
jgi:hypothetical protein